MPGSIARAGSTVMIGALIEAGDLAAAESACAAALARCRDAGDALNLPQPADGRWRTWTCRPAVSRTPPRTCAKGSRSLCGPATWWNAGNGLWSCALLCAATGRYAEAATVWAAHAAHVRQQGIAGQAPAEVRREQEALSKVRQALGPDRARAAEERGAAMSLDTAAEYALMLTAPAPPPARGTGTGLGRLSARERELVTLVAQGRTDAQIAAQLYISIRTVRSHLDRIRDKTGCRRRADLTRLALTEGLV